MQSTTITVYAVYALLVFLILLRPLIWLIRNWHDESTYGWRFLIGGVLMLTFLGGMAAAIYFLSPMVPQNVWYAVALLVGFGTIKRAWKELLDAIRHRQ